MTGEVLSEVWIPLPFLSFSLITMTSSPLDVLRGGLVPAGLVPLTICSPITGGHGTETGAWPDRGAGSWSSMDGWSSPGQMAEDGTIFTDVMANFA